VARGYLGVHLAQTLEATDAVKLGLDRAQGALVEAVYADTPAAAAGLKANDVILSVDGLPIRNENHLINHIAALPVGSRVKLHVWRDRRAAVIEASVGDWNQAQARLKADK
jgi:serine protease Do